jgi:hypothetical protein
MTNKCPAVIGHSGRMATTSGHDATIVAGAWPRMMAQKGQGEAKERPFRTVDR